MTWLLWLPEVLRAAGLTVYEYDGREHDGKTWRTRGSDQWGPIRGITCHATAGSSTSTDAGELRVLVTGSASAPPPIAQLYLSRSGAWWVVASGRSNHNLTGWAGPNEGLGNNNLLGVEAQNDNRGQTWPAVQYASYVRGVAALVRRLGIPVSRVAGHKEHQPWPAPKGQSSTKSDPTFDMNRFRADVSATLAKKGDATMNTAQEKKLDEALRLLRDMPKAVVDVDAVPAARPPWANADFQTNPQWRVGYALQTSVEGARATLHAVEMLRAELARYTGQQPLDPQVIIHGVLAGLAPEVLAAHIVAVMPESLARQVVDELSRALQTRQQG